jgi:CRISPR locus-related DNA-binding protein
VAERGVESGYVVVGVLCFDEKFLARCIMRAFTGAGIHGVVVIVPGPGDEYSAKRIGEARESLERLIRDYMGLEPVFVEVKRASMRDAFRAARDAMRDALSKGHPVVVCLSSGMRYTLLALLLALLSLQDSYPALEGSRVEVDLESGEGYLSVPARRILALRTISNTDVLVLETLWRLGSAGVDSIAEASGLPKSTTYKSLQRLVSLGLVEKLGRKRGYRPLFP